MVTTYQQALEAKWLSGPSFYEAMAGGQKIPMRSPADPTLASGISNNLREDNMAEVFGLVEKVNVKYERAKEDVRKAYRAGDFEEFRQSVLELMADIQAE